MRICPRIALCSLTIVASAIFAPRAMARTAGDYDGDGKADLAFFRPSNGTWYIVPSSNPASPITQAWGTQGDIPVPGDYDGDGKTDFAVWRPSTGQWFIIPSSNPTSPITQAWGTQGDIPVPGDYDGDGKTDFAVWRPSSGTWYIIPSSNPTNHIAQQWGTGGDIPTPGDYDGDGKSDFAVWRPSSGTWYIIPSSNPTSTITQQLGLNGDIPVAADYDGDHKTDLAVWRTSSGTWYVIPSSNPSSTITQQWGLTGDVPVPADYDGDGKVDYAVWRPSNASWYIIPSSNPSNPTTTQWGTSSDVPVQGTTPYATPIISSLSPTEGPTGTSVTITGANFGAVQSNSTIAFNGTVASAITTWTSNSITATVSTGATTGDVDVTVLGVTNADGHTFTVTASGGSGPYISSLSPTQGPIGTQVTITGLNFGSAGTVTFNDMAASTSSWTSTSITATVPTGATTGDVAVTVSGVRSDAGDFAVTGSAVSTTSDIYFYFSDELGTARVITTSNGTVCYDADLYPYGGLRAYNLNCSPSRTFTTYERDPETNNDYAMARFFRSSLGRFMSPDPTGIFLGNTNDPQQLNLYSYVRNNPLTLTDPSGLCDPDDPTCDGGGGCGFFGCGGCDPWTCGGGNGGGSPRIAPQPPISIAPQGGSPNPSNGSASNDPFGGETNGIPDGLQVPTLGRPGLGCTYGGGSCGGGIYGFTDGGGVLEGLGGLCAVQPETCGLFVISVTAYGLSEVYLASRHQDAADFIAKEMGNFLNHVRLTNPDQNPDPGNRNKWKRQLRGKLDNMRARVKRLSPRTQPAADFLIDLLNGMIGDE